MTNSSLDLSSQLLNNRYYLHDAIAQSNYSRVFLASDLLRHRKCVVKQLCLNLCPAKVKQAIESMFWQEAQILQKLTGKHPQICQFYGYFSDNDALYLVQEWIPGITLEQKLHQQHKLSESETKEILLSLLSVLECIHRLGIIHRDIKPNNIILRSENNLPVLIDFGVAQKVGDRRKPTIIVGTPGYMSLEQAMGQAAYDNDLYSLGLTAIHLLTGQSPQNVNFEHYEPFFQRNLTTAIARAISPQSNQRFASATEMRSALQYSEERAAVTQPNSSKFKLRLWAIGLIIGAQVAGAYLGWRYLIVELDEQPPINFTDLPQRQLPLLTDDELENTAKPTVLETKNKALQAVIFMPGTSQTKITQALGEPVGRKPGFWANSIAWSYKNIISEGIDLGYIFDTQTNELRQAEIAVPPSTDFSTVRSALNALLSVETLSADLEPGLQAVYQRQKATYNFTTGDLEGIVQRNQQDRIYIAVWSADFH
ncbi:MAG TPA: serine/threonine-protein kinase [Coleofasciculaceae cyanobacterium]|jgi:serine/threonine-protein kinase